MSDHSEKEKHEQYDHEDHASDEEEYHEPEKKPATPNNEGNTRDLILTVFPFKAAGQR